MHAPIPFLPGPRSSPRWPAAPSPPTSPPSWRRRVSRAPSQTWTSRYPEPQSSILGVVLLMFGRACVSPTLECSIENCLYVRTYAPHIVSVFQYSGTPLLWTPRGPGEVSCTEMCPHFWGKFILRNHIWDAAKCPQYRCVHISGVSFKRGSTV